MREPHFRTIPEALQEKRGWEQGEEAVPHHHPQPVEESKRVPGMDILGDEVIITNGGGGGKDELEIIEGASGDWLVNKTKNQSFFNRTRMARRGPPIIKDATKEEGKSSTEMEQISKRQQPILILADGDEIDMGKEEGREVMNSVEASNPTEGVRNGQGRGHKPFDDSSIVIGKEAMKLSEESRGNTEYGGGGGGIRLGRLHKGNGDGSRRDRKRTSNSTVATTPRKADGGLEILRETIEMLCQYIAPLGHSMNYVYEDLTMMDAEREKWRKECRFNQDKLEAEKEATEEALQPLKAKLLALEEKVRGVLIYHRVMRHE